MLSSVGMFHRNSFLVVLNSLLNQSLKICIGTMLQITNTIQYRLNLAKMLNRLHYYIIARIFRRRQPIKETYDVFKQNVWYPQHFFSVWSQLSSRNRFTEHGVLNVLNKCLPFLRVPSTQRSVTIFAYIILHCVSLI